MSKNINLARVGKLKEGKRILLLDGVTVSFDGFKALNNLGFYMNYRELLCIIGANGAGKSTMMDVVTGKLRPDEGQVIYGEAVNLLQLDEPAIANLGIGRKFQKPTVFENQTVFENLELAMESDKTLFKTLFAKLSDEEKDKIEATIKLIGLQDMMFALAGKLSHGQKQWLEIGMLMMQNPKVLLIDEPVAGMTPEEVAKTTEIITSLAKSNAVIVVEHDMEFIRSIATKVLVLHEGSVLTEGSMDHVQNHEAVRKVYLGE